REGNFETAWSSRATIWWKLPTSLGSMFRKLVLYSRHNVWAGRQWDWHYGVARIYLLFLPFLVLAILSSVYWLAVPLLLWAARTGKTLWKKREGRSVWWV